MIFRMAMAFAVVVLLAPREPDLGLGQPTQFAQLPVVSAFRTAALDRLAEIRAEIGATRHRLPAGRLGMAS